MYKNVLRSIEGIEIYPVISFVIFFVFFLGLTLYVISLDKGSVEIMRNKPLADDDNDMSNEKNKYHASH